MFFGWLPDIPDVRDYTIDSPEIRPYFASKPSKSAKIPSKIDLRTLFPPIVDQGRLGSCTANAAAGIIGYYLCANSAFEPVSRLFTYKTTRNLMETDGDTGAYIRTTMGSLALFGSPPEKYYDYDISRFDDEPPAFCYSFASGFQAISYFRLDCEKSGNAEILSSIKETLARKYPCMFGFTVYESIGKSPGGKIPFPAKGEKTIGGHAVCAAGYDDNMKIGSGDSATTGAFIIRNSWGESWGEKGYGYLPYEYVLQGLALDWWCLLKAEWVDLKQFGI